jgi:integrase
MALSDIAIKSAKPKDKLYKLTDSNGLQLWVFPDGAKRWRYQFRLDGKQRILALGVYPRLGLKEARQARDAAMEIKDAGNDPVRQRQQEKENRSEARAITFALVAEELLEKKKKEGIAPATIKQISWCFRNTKSIDNLPITEVKAPDVLSCVRKIEDRGKFHSANRLLSKIGEVFRYAIATGRASEDPSTALKGALITHKAKNFPAIVHEKPFGRLLRLIEDYHGVPEVKYALKLLTLTFVRSTTLRFTTWGQIDLNESIWHIPADNMKRVRGVNKELFVPLAPQTVALLRELQVITGDGNFLFPSVRTKARPISENTINAALRSMGIRKDEHCGHGFRASAMTMLNESGLWNRDAISVQMGHEERDAVRRAYARGEYWAERVKMMTWWANKCDELRAGQPLALPVSEACAIEA